MSLPELVQSVLGEESIVARIALRDDDALFVSPTKTLHYRGQSLLSDESVDEFPHAAERVSLSSGRRKTTIDLDYGLDGTRSLAVPNDCAEAALHPVLAGVLSAAGVVDAGETVRETFRFSELTLVVTDDRLIKHVGRAVWDAEFEEFHFDDIAGFGAEEGRVATQFVLTVSNGQERIKIPNECARAFRECLEDALLVHHGVETLADLSDLDGPADSDDPDDTETEDEAPVESASAEKGTDPSDGAVSLHELGGMEDEPSSVARLDALATALDRQQELLDDQRRELDRLREDLTRDP